MGDYIETREGFLIEFNKDKPEHASKVFTKEGVLISPNAKIHIDNPQTKTLNKWNITFYKANNVIVIGKSGLCGGGNCATSNGQKPRKASASIVPPTDRRPSSSIIKPFDNTPTTEDIKEEAKVEEDPGSPAISFKHDERQEEKILGYIDEVFNSFKEGSIEGEIIEKIESIGLPGTVKLYEIGARFLELLTKKVIYKWKKWEIFRERLAKQARRYLGAYMVVSKLIPSFKEEHQMPLQDYVTKIKDLLRICESTYPETTFAVYINSIDQIVTQISSGVPLLPHLSVYIQLMVNELLNETPNVSIGTAKLYIEDSVKKGRSLLSDLIVLAYMEQPKATTNASIELLIKFITKSMKSTWEQIVAILDTVEILILHTQNPDLLEQLNKLSNFRDPDVIDDWRIRAKTIETLIKIKEQTHKFDEEIDLILSQRALQESHPNVKKMFEFSDFYRECLKTYHKRISEEDEDEEEDEEKPIIHPYIQYSGIGRDSEVQLIRNSFGSAQNKIIALVGDSGIGKTALAVKYSQVYNDLYSAILFIPSQSANNISFVFLKLFRKIELHIRDTFDDNIYSIKEYLDNQSKPALLIFDDAENLESIRNFLPNKGHIIVTSSLPEWENIIEVKPILSETCALILSKYTELFNDSILRIAEGMPISLELIGRYINYYKISPEEYKDLHSECKQSLKKIEFQGFSPLELSAATVWKCTANRLSKDHPYFLNFLSCLTFIDVSGISQDIALKVFFHITKISDASKYEVFTYTLNKLGIIIKDEKHRIKIHPFIAKIIVSQTHQTQQLTLALQQIFTQEIGDLDILSTFCITGKASLHIKKLSKYIIGESSLEAGIVFYEKGRYEMKVELNFSEAAQSFNHSIEILTKYNHPDRYQAYYGEAYCNLKLHKTREASDLFTKIIQECKNKDLLLYSKVGICSTLSELGKFNELEKILKSKEILGLTSPDAIFSISQSIIEIGVLNQDFHEILRPYEPIIEDQVSAPENVIVTLIILIKIALGFSFLELYKKCCHYLAYISSLISQPPPMSEELSGLVDYSENLLEPICKIVGTHHDILSDYHILIANFYIACKRSEEALNHLKCALEIRVQRYGLDDLKIAKILYFLSKCCTNKPKAMKYALDAERIIKTTVGEDHLFCAHTCERIGLLHLADSQIPEATEYLEKALEIRQKIVPTSHYECCKSYASLAKLAQNQNQPEEALELYERALNYLLDQPKHLTSDVAQWAYAAFRICRELNNPQKALEFRLKQVEAAKNNIEHNNEETLELLIKTAEFAESMQKYKEAIQCYLDCFEITKEGFDEDETEFLVKAAENYSKIGKSDGFKKCMGQVLEIRKIKFGDRSLEVGKAYNKLAGFYLGASMWNEAILEYESADEIHYCENEKDELAKAQFLCDFGYCQLKLGSDNDAMKHLKESLKIIKGKSGKNSEAAGVCYHYMGLANIKNKQIALIYLEKAFSIFKSTLGESHEKTSEIGKIIADLNKF
ncbi:unnamed protein product [Blepharisma stoltei]|uniref:NB-ARC domain-containing protein n=1 Tax=Blepharisma stoltei TaxID=1481888 RepID=A0AAU9K6L7_9CILI|nr:unnamed protein product [Blepharisma stoltei]